MKDVKDHLSSKFDMKYIGIINFILDMEIERGQDNRRL